MTTTSERHATKQGWPTVGLPAQTDESFEIDEERRNRPWSRTDYEAVRQAAIDLVRTHTPHDLPGGDVRACVDGRAMWALLGALDREGAR